MSGAPAGGGIPTAARRLLAFAARLVPGHRRDDWLRQWTADVQHLCGRPEGRRVAVRYAAGSLRHAAWLRVQELRPAGGAADLRLAARGLRWRSGSARPPRCSAWPRR
jgi:hypothetical protein